MLQRNTPLKSNSKLKSVAPLKRRTPLKSAAPSWGAAPSGDKRSKAEANEKAGTYPERKPRKPLERKPMERKPFPEAGTYPDRKSRPPLPRTPKANKPPKEPKPRLYPVPDQAAAKERKHPDGGAPTKPRKPKTPRAPKALREGEVGEKKTRLIIAERSGGVCEICGLAPVTDAAHRKPRSQGGLWSPSNLLASCRPCHAGNHSQPVKAVANGWHLAMGSAPREEPTTLCIEGVFRKVLLDDAGGLLDVA
jgi:hypothetical protein